MIKCLVSKDLLGFIAGEEHQTSYHVERKVSRPAYSSRRRRTKPRTGSESFPYPLPRGGACAHCAKRILFGQKCYAGGAFVFCSVAHKKKGAVV